MREILFRGKQIDKCDEWTFGGIVHQTDYYGKPVDRYFIIDGKETQDYDIGYEREVVKETVGEYTGLNDKNGRKIFEGDILKAKYCFGFVKYINGCFFVINDKEETPIDVAIELGDLEVIGNIYDNQDFLNQSGS